MSTILETINSPLLEHARDSDLRRIEPTPNDFADRLAREQDAQRQADRADRASERSAPRDERTRDTDARDPDTRDTSRATRADNDDRRADTASRRDRADDTTANGGSEANASAETPPQETSAATENADAGDAPLDEAGQSTPSNEVGEGVTLNPDALSQTAADGTDAIDGANVALDQEGTLDSLAQIQAETNAAVAATAANTAQNQATLAQGGSQPSVASAQSALAEGEPGALAQWYARASNPTQLALSDAANGQQPSSQLGANGVGTATNGQQSTNLFGAAQSGEAAANPLLTSTSTATSSDTLTSFSDALAASNANTDAIETAFGGASSKANPSLELASAQQPTLTTGQTITTGAQPGVTAVPQATTGQAVPISSVAVEVARQVLGGKTQFDVRLDPPELGRLNVRIEMDASGQTRTHMIVERAETLEMLVTDARSLERALQQAGVKTEPGSVSFELASDGQDGSAGHGASGENAGTGDQGDGALSANERGSGDEPTGLSDDIPADVESAIYQIPTTGQLDLRV
ncbi:MAG: flagellar hook-length control protein FliK [Pseudomonadota bacterium]